MPQVEREGSGNAGNNNNNINWWKGWPQGFALSTHLVERFQCFLECFSSIRSLTFSLFNEGRFLSLNCLGF